MGAKPPHAHCHYCDTMARVDGKDTCAGCGEQVSGPLDPMDQATEAGSQELVEFLVPCVQHTAVGLAAESVGVYYC
jgi:hypothetical protein